MKKAVALLLTLPLLFSLFTLPIFAAPSPAMQVLAEDVTLIKTGLLGKKLVFSDTDFKQALAVADFEKITVTEVPSSAEGSLLLNGRKVSAGQSIRRRSLSSLVFVPADRSVTEATFRFSVYGMAGGADMPCVMKFIDKINYAPEIGKSAAVSVSTQAGVSFFGNLSGSDPEGDLLTYQIVVYPTKGSLTLTDRNTGAFRYTPSGSYTGTDSFVYVVRDEYGNYSEAEKVTVKVEKRKSNAEYVDMKNSSAYNAALTVTAEGIMSGRLIGDGLYFEPDKNVSRAEFVALVMKAAGIKPDSTLKASCFDDGDEIPSALLGYVATAQKVGIVNGSFTDGRLIFRPNDAVTVAEAAIILSRAVGANASGESDAAAELADVPVWARPSLLAMRDTGIFTRAELDKPNATVTRADTAKYLAKILA